MAGSRKKTEDCSDFETNVKAQPENESGSSLASDPTASQRSPPSCYPFLSTTEKDDTPTDSLGLADDGGHSSPAGNRSIASPSSTGVSSDDKIESHGCLIETFGNIDLETAKFLVDALEGAVEFKESWEPLLEPFLGDAQAAIRVLASDPLETLHKAKARLLDNQSGRCSSDSTLSSAFTDSMRSLPQQSTQQVSPFERFRNPRRTVMNGAHNRAVSLRQLRLVVAYIGEHANADGFLPWTDWNPQSNTYGLKLHVDTVNLYHLVEWVIKPVTRDFQCSLVEVLSDTKQQPPKWFVSHVWRESIKDFLASIEEHARVRGLSEDDFWWVCGYANNQHSIDDDINIDPDPRKTSFYRAMQQCEGVLLCLDSEANPFARIWCCFEEAMIVNGGKKILKLDISTVVARKGVVLTDGLVESDYTHGPKFALEMKRERESGFPLQLLERGYIIDIRKATASHEPDIRRILNAIAGVPADELDLRDPDLLHPSFESTNQALRGIFAEAAARKAAEAGRLESLLKILREDVNRTTLTLNLGGCHELDLTPMKCLAGHPNLERIFLDCAYCSIPNMEWIDGSLTQLCRLCELSFNLSGCSILNAESFRHIGAIKNMQKLKIDASYSGISDVSGIGAAFPRLANLEELWMDFGWCSKLDDVAALSEGLPSLSTLKVLNISFQYCELAVDLPGLGRLHNLQMLSIDYSYTQTGTKALTFLRKLKNLLSLKLHFEGCKQLCHLSQFSAIGDYQFLEDLSLSFAYTNIGGAGALQNLDAAPRLREASLNFAKCARLRSVKWIPKAVSRMRRFTVDLSDCGGLPQALRGVFSDTEDLLTAYSNCEISQAVNVKGATLFTGEVKGVNQHDPNTTVEILRSSGESQTTSTSKSKRREKTRNHAKLEARYL